MLFLYHYAKWFWFCHWVSKVVIFFCGQLSICCMCIYRSFPAVSNYEMLMKINEILSEYEKSNSKVLNHIKIHRHIIIALNLSCYSLHFSFKNTGARSLYLIKALYQQWFQIESKAELRNLSYNLAFISSLG